MKSLNIKKLTGVGILTAVVIILQLIGSAIHFGPFSVSLVNVPIVVGAALYGVFAGGWLGFIFGLTVLLSGDAGLFLAVNAAGSIITVLVKGIAAGAVSGLVYQLLDGKTKPFAAVMAAAVACPVVNTGIFLIGCLIFFMKTVAGWAEGAGFGGNVGRYMLVGFVGFNFLFELLINVVLAPIIVRMVKIARKNKF